MTLTIGIVALNSSSQQDDRRPGETYQLPYDALKNQEAMTKTTTETTLHRTAGEPPLCLQCHLG